MTALLSIKPEFVQAIFDGTKQFEFRKVNFKRKIDKIKIYATKPVGKIVGEFIVDDILKASPEELWDKTNLYAGIDKERYFQYFSGKNMGFAIKIKSVNKYKEPICPYLQYPKFVAPQSFKYI
ncbi:ASCH domain-containing protein [uncultured Campylobacter sp.]|uniref:ASCH domain-containing protein n=1 Tax=uncultured Campylobacter sp. TaxID=218934 RepID=UPI00262148EA|nr:ASCH domain-containing protein [uncultured Campylobacter sp.]